MMLVVEGLSWKTHGLTSVVYQLDASCLMFEWRNMGREEVKEKEFFLLWGISSIGEQNIEEKTIRERDIEIKERKNKN